MAILQQNGPTTESFKKEKKNRVMKESTSQLKPLINKRKLIIEITKIIQWNSFYSHFQFKKLKLREIK